MDGLDLDALTDDQVLGLMRLLYAEAVRRSPQMRAAMEAAVVDEREKARIALEAAEREARKIRAAEREEVARKAAEEVRREKARQDDVKRAADLKDKHAKKEEDAKRLADELLAADEARREHLRRASAIVGVPPEDLTLVTWWDGKTGVKCAALNRGADRYSQDHLAALRLDDVAVVRPLVAKRAELTLLLTTFRAAYPTKTGVAVIGAELFVAAPKEHINV